MTADDLRALSAAATSGPWTADDFEVWGDGEAVAIGLMPEDAVLIEWLRNHASAVADLIEAAREIDSDDRLGLPPTNGAVGDLRAALAALDQEPPT